MDKQQKIGIALIFLVLIGFSFWNTPSKEEIEARKRAADSVAAVEKQKQINEVEKQASLRAADSIAKADPKAAVEKYGSFGAAMGGVSTDVILENNLVKIEIPSKGGVPAKVTLKEYTTYEKQPLVLFDKNTQRFNLELASVNGIVNTEDLYFTPSNVTASTVTLTAKAGDGFISFDYKLPADSYMLNFDITTNNLKSALRSSETTRLLWNSKITRKEKSSTFESRYAELGYKFFGENTVDNLSATGEDEEDVSNLHWVAFKDQYFSAVLIADGGGRIASAKLKSVEANGNDHRSEFIKSYSADAKLGFNAAENQTSRYRFFYGPNKYKLLCSYDDDTKGDEVLKLNKLIPLGWAVFRWVNQLIVIPLFNLLENFISNYGLLIFLLTVIIKLILFPFSYKSYLSTAKMRVLKPEIERLQAEIPADNTMERQQVSMKVYQKAGVNPMGGCLPMLLSMPILIAMFTFFPTAIELRGHSFLWADDLSAYDSILDFGFNIPFYGDHVSLFCLLMTVVNIIYTKFNMQMTDTGAQQQMPMMKYMMYFMPVMFLFIFNDYASGLTYYYFVSLLLTIIQTVAMRYTIDDEKLLQKINEKAEKNKASNKKGWMQRLAEMQEEQKKMLEQQRKNKQ